jgi:hypothetical protein
MSTQKFRFMTLLLLGIVGFMFQSCTSDNNYVATPYPGTAHFKIVNKSGQDIDSLWMSNSSSEVQVQKRMSIKNQDSIHYELKMPSGYSDGSYSLRYKGVHLPQRFYPFGYYTNSSQWEKLVELVILRDTVVDRSVSEKQFIEALYH